MKLVLSRRDLWQGIDTVLEAVPSKPSMPMLANILMVADGGGLSLAATDLDLSIRTRVPAQVDREGSVGVPARMLAEITREWPEAELSLEVSDLNLHLEGQVGGKAGGQGKYSLAGVAADEFPVFPEQLAGTALDLANAEGLTAATIAEMIQRTAFAVSREDTRPVLNGALWRLDSGGMLVVATDAHRFAHYRLSTDLSAQLGSSTCSAIVPAPAMAQMSKLLGTNAPRTALVFGDTHLMLDLGATQLVTRLIAGPYVDYQQVIPRGNDRRLRVATEEFLPAVRRVSTLASAYTHQIRLALRPGIVELSANSPEVGGEALEVIPAEYDGEPMQTGYNAQYLMEILRRMGSSAVTFELADQVTAALLRPDGEAGNRDYFCLLMPLRSTG
jgi:DNA polymerase III subunit beta